MQQGVGAEAAGCRCVRRKSAVRGVLEEETAESHAGTAGDCADEAAAPPSPLALAAGPGTFEAFLAVAHRRG
jgi:hypothetical protein